MYREKGQQDVTSCVATTKTVEKRASRGVMGTQDNETATEEPNIVGLAFIWMH